MIKWVGDDHNCHNQKRQVSSRIDICRFAFSIEIYGINQKDESFLRIGRISVMFGMAKCRCLLTATPEKPDSEPS